MSVVETVIDRFGGLTRLSEKLGHENPSTVQGWKERKRIPLTQWPAIERAAAKEGFTDITVAWLCAEHMKLVSTASAV